MKLCKDCKHFRPTISNEYICVPAGCVHEKNFTLPDPVYGKRSLDRSPAGFRDLYGKCGPDALLWEQMPARPPKTPPRFWEFWK